MIRTILGILFIAISLGIVIGFFKQEWNAIIGAFDSHIGKHILEGLIGYWVFQGLFTFLNKSWNVSIVPVIIILLIAFAKEWSDMLRGFSFKFLDVKIRLIGAFYGLVIWGIVLQTIKWIRMI